MSASKAAHESSYSQKCSMKSESGRTGLYDRNSMAYLMQEAPTPPWRDRALQLHYLGALEKRFAQDAAPWQAYFQDR
jgi:hypothetical protein